MYLGTSRSFLITLTDLQWNILLKQEDALGILMKIKTEQNVK